MKKNKEQLYFDALINHNFYKYQEPRKYRNLLNDRKKYYNEFFNFSENNILKLVAINNGISKKEKIICHQYLELKKTLNNLKESKNKWWDINYDFSISLFSDEIFQNNEEFIGNPFLKYEIMGLRSYLNQYDLDLFPNNYDEIIKQASKENYYNRFEFEPQFKKLSKYKFCDTMQQLILYSYASLQDIIKTDEYWFELKFEVQNNYKPKINASN